MLDKEYLTVWCEKSLVGKLWCEYSGNIGFQYVPSWVDNGFAISQRLPLRMEAYDAGDGLAHQFFVNLLPEAGARMHIVRDLKLTNSDFEILKAIGGECAGALSILPAKQELDSTFEYRELSAKELSTIFYRKSGFIELTSEEDRPRLSLAGAQDKFPICFDNNKFSLPISSSPSTHILKFEVPGYRHIPAYEYFLNKLAKGIGLPVVDSYLNQHEKMYYLLVKRYDRITDENNIQRLHQEDFCQALGVRYEHKYEQDGGPGFIDCYNLIKRISMQPIVDADNLLMWQIFNVLAGNSDGHAKNLAILYGKNSQCKLAPFYDLVCTRAIERIDNKLAISVGKEFNPELVTIKHWTLLARECNIREQYLHKLLVSMANKLIIQVPLITENFEKHHGAYPALQRVRQVILKQCKRILLSISKSSV